MAQGVWPGGVFNVIGFAYSPIDVLESLANRLNNCTLARLMNTCHAFYDGPFAFTSNNGPYFLDAMEPRKQEFLRDLETRLGFPPIKTIATKGAILDVTNRNISADDARVLAVLCLQIPENIKARAVRFHDKIVPLRALFHDAALEFDDSDRQSILHGLPFFAKGLQHNKSLTNLSISSVGIEGIQALARKGAFTNSLTRLALRHNMLNAESIKTLAECGSFRTLTSLDLTMNLLDLQGAKALVAYGVFSSTLKSIDLATNCFRVEAAEVLAPAIRESGLTYLCLSNNEFGSQGVKALVEGGAFQGSLTSVDLNSNGFGALGAKALVDGGVIGRSLTSLDVRNNYIVDEGTIQLSEAVLAQHNQIQTFNEVPIEKMRADSLTELNLSRMMIGNVGGMVVARLLPLATSLMSIDLKINRLDAWVVETLAPAIAVASSLTRIDVGFNNFNLEATLELLTAMKGKSMVSIGMADCLLGVKGAKIVAEYISVTDSLTSLDLCYNNLRAEGVKALVEAGAFRSSLTSLNLGGNKVKAEGVQALTDGGAFCSSLMSLSLKDNNLGPVAVKALVDGGAFEGPLTNLDLSCNQLNVQIVQKRPGFTLII